jgi:GTPase SAR1 family protein
VKVILVGNKNDLEKERQVNEDEAIIFAKENGIFF